MCYSYHNYLTRVPRSMRSLISWMHHLYHRILELESNPSEDPSWGLDWAGWFSYWSRTSSLWNNAGAEQAVSARVSVAVSVTSAVLREEPHIVPHHVYAYLVRECDMMYGQNYGAEMHLVESMAGGAIRGIPVPVSDARIKIEALTEIAARRMRGSSIHQ